ncbi:MAG: hypothetical protein ACXVI6_06425 [Candidatus Aminicenantales bacterium]
MRGPRKGNRWLLLLSLAFIALSALIYAANYLIFHNPREMFFLMINDFAFLFVNVLLVIVLIERLLARREKRLILKKLNMVIGTFFSEVGLELLRCFSGYMENAQTLKQKLNVLPTWTHKDFQRAIGEAQSFPFELKIEPAALAELKTFFQGKRNFLVMLLENPNLLEHDRFTDLLWAVFHLAEELDFRRCGLDSLPEADYRHLMNDAKRACSHLTAEWVAYTEHLKETYPFLFSLAARMNPFNPDASAIIR